MKVSITLLLLPMVQKKSWKNYSELAVLWRLLIKVWVTIKAIKPATYSHCHNCHMAFKINTEVVTRNVEWASKAIMVLLICLNKEPHVASEGMTSASAQLGTCSSLAVLWTCVLSLVSFSLLYFSVSGAIFFFTVSLIFVMLSSSCSSYACTYVGSNT